MWCASRGSYLAVSASNLGRRAYKVFRPNPRGSAGIVVSEAPRTGYNNRGPLGDWSECGDLPGNSARKLLVHNARMQFGHTQATVLSICNKNSQPLLSMTKDEFEAFLKLAPFIVKQMELFERKLD